MKRGLVLGKFMPLHQGHRALIQYAASQCDEVIISMTYRPEDPIPGTLRLEWIQEEFKNLFAVKPAISLDDFDDETLSWEKRIPRWSAFLKKRFPKIDIIFSSETYGNSLADHLGIPYVNFDLDRNKFPVSGTLIRQHPFRYWDYIAPSARSYFVKKICLYGPESTGKSTMAKHLAEIYHTEFVPEVSREVVTTNDFTVNDIIQIGYAQTERVQEKLKMANKILFCDTDVITTQIYCRHYLKVVPSLLFELEKLVVYDRYYLFDIDVPWVADEIRDLGERREEMLNVFKKELDDRKIPYKLVNGSYEDREKFLYEDINELLNDLS